MSQFKFLFVSALAAALALPLAARADSAECELHAFKANRVEPLRVQERIGRGTIEKLAGAQVFVPAQKGLTAEWLRARVEQHISGMSSQGMANCPLGVKGVRVTVASGGTGFWVKLQAKDSETAHEVLRLARAAVR
ncbi:MAG TPA: hypothetical protein VFQ35_10255 [Polyangiaceae bacterium]|nr:hypothetical protein [Polyangiaceae bacterium]